MRTGNKQREDPGGWREGLREKESRTRKQKTRNHETMLGLNFAVINGRKEPFQPRVGSPGAHQTSVHPEWVLLTKLGKKL